MRGGRKGTTTAIGAVSIVLGMVLLPNGTWAAEQPIEEVEIIGERFIHTLRNEIFEAEVQAFDLFNKLNDDKLLKVTCRSVIVTGSLIPDRECVPEYINRARNYSATDFIFFKTTQKTDEVIWEETREKHARFNAKMRELARRAPELAAALTDVQQKRERLAEVEARQD